MKLAHTSIVTRLVRTHTARRRRVICTSPPSRVVAHRQVPVLPKTGHTYGKPFRQCCPDRTSPHAIAIQRWSQRPGYEVVLQPARDVICDYCCCVSFHKVMCCVCSGGTAVAGRGPLDMDLATTSMKTRYRSVDDLAKGNSGTGHTAIIHVVV